MQSLILAPPARPGPDATPDPAVRLAGVIEQLGIDGFLPAMLAWCHQALGASDCSLILHRQDPQAPPPELAAAASVQGDRAEQVGDWYMRGGWYRLEPNARVAQAAPDALQLLVLQLHELPDSRWRDQYERSGLAERLSLIVPVGGGWLFFNVYRPPAAGLALTMARDTLAAQSPWLAAALRRHVALQRAGGGAASPLDGLSVRERQVVDAILGGASAKEAARQLGLSPTSVATYRQRAFEKLGIRRQVQLFQLMRG